MGAALAQDLPRISVGSATPPLSTTPTSEPAEAGHLPTTNPSSLPSELRALTPSSGILDNMLTEARKTEAKAGRELNDETKSLATDLLDHVKKFGTDTTSAPAPRYSGSLVDAADALKNLALHPDRELVGKDTNSQALVHDLNTLLKNVAATDKDAAGAASETIKSLTSLKTALDGAHDYSISRGADLKLAQELMKAGHYAEAEKMLENIASTDTKMQADLAKKVFDVEKKLQSLGKGFEDDHREPIFLDPGSKPTDTSMGIAGSGMLGTPGK